MPQRKKKKKHNAHIKLTSHDRATRTIALFCFIVIQMLYYVYEYRWI